MNREAPELLPSDEPVTVVISRFIKRGMEKEFEQWIRDVTVVAHEFEGHLGTNVMKPAISGQSEYVIVFRFDNYYHLKQWEDSSVRRAWLKKAEHLIEGETRVHKVSGLEYWFELPDQPLASPPRYKMAIVAWIAIFPLVLVVPPFLSSFLGDIPSLLQTFLIAGVMIALMSFVAMPLMTRLFAWWLYPNRDRAMK